MLCVKGFLLFVISFHEACNTLSLFLSLAPFNLQLSNFLLFFLKQWQNIVTNFSSLELGLLDENTTNNSETQSGGVVDLAVDESMEQSSNGAIGFRSNTICSCLVDRNRSIKYSKSSSRSSSTTSTQQTNSALLNQPAALLANMNLFYELVDSLPELSRMEVK